jgi:hypothetical protein
VLSHPEKAVPSSEQAKVAPSVVELSSKLALAEPESVGGAAVIAVSGADVSTVHVVVAGLESALPAASVARAAKVCSPSPRPA